MQQFAGCCCCSAGLALSIWGLQHPSVCPQLQGTGNLISGCVSVPAVPRPSVLNTHCVAGTACCSATVAHCWQDPISHNSGFVLPLCRDDEP